MKKFYQCSQFQICIASLVIQQVIVALSTLFIARLSEGVARGSPGLPDFACFLASLVLVYLPGILSIISLERSKNSLLKSYVESFKRKYKGHSLMSGNQSVKSSLKPWLTSEAMITIREAASFYYSFLSTFLNAIFGIISIVYVLSFDFLFAYLSSFFLVLLLMILSRKQISRLSVKHQKSRKNLSSALDVGYTNILFGNPGSFPQWHENYQNHFDAYNFSSIRYISSLHGFSALAMMGAFIPVSGMLIYHFHLMPEAAVLLTIVATLPRQVQILQSMHQMTSHLFERQGIRAKMSQLSSSLDLPATEMTHLIQWNILSLDIDCKDAQEKSNNMKEKLGQFLDKEGGGRATIRGVNGAGKSVLKKYLKDSWGARAFYLPANGDIYFESLAKQNLSSGEKILEILKILDNIDEQTFELILLDEWDANLDSENILTANSLVKSLSVKFKVIETRHREFERPHAPRQKTVPNKNDQVYSF